MEICDWCNTPKEGVQTGICTNCGRFGKTENTNGVHLKHCFQGEYKYGDHNCPAKPKQDTLEDAAENWLYDLENTNPSVLEKGYPLVPMEFGFIEGAKWQQEKNKQDLKDLWNFVIERSINFLDDESPQLGTFEEWFQQYKK